MILALDTSSDMTGLALFDGRRLVAEQLWNGAGRATAEVAPEIALLLRRTHSSIDSLTGIAVALGPGSFTGLRIGLALARGLALGGRRRLVGVPTLDILAAGQPARHEPMLALLRAGRGRLAGVWYKWSKRGWKAQGEPQSFTWEGLRERLTSPAYVCGELDADEREAWEPLPGVTIAGPALCVRRPGVLAELGWHQLQARKIIDPLKLTPIYLSTLEQAAASPDEERPTTGRGQSTRQRSA
ncbi:MAG TPA: tRNA (adenosine(37)-N6)-threonylcarbamoyltransferase complex dimerization subunit type 1 TsaB [Anaerolineales bacterium]|nr:tRNA (adenosine(37)-N6)-threonylcarbamoyltransferase complex dimerization subunit type 1 TsaB [Anaerolineales bacterium]